MTNKPTTADVVANAAAPTDGAPIPKSDCYAGTERAWMQYGQDLRAQLLAPLLRWLTLLGITADHLTLLAAVLGLSFVPLWLVSQHWLALAMLLAHVFLDGLDGPLARFQSKASPRGSFTDTFSDQLVVTAVTAAWMVTNPSAGYILAGTMYIFLYALVVGMAMVRNYLQVPYTWLIRPRFLVYVAMAVDCAFPLHLCFCVLLACNLLLAIKSASGFLALRRTLYGPA